MSQSLTKIYIHIIFSTKGRNPWIIQSIQKELYAYIASILKGINCPALIVGGVMNHIHILNIQSKNISTSKLIKEVKASSSKWIKSKDKKFKNFSWQNGYAAFSVSQSLRKQVHQYILNQKYHHQKRSFKDEMRLLLKRYEVDYDEKYFWD